MDKMTGVERTANLMYRRPVDRIGLYEHFWSDTHREWENKGWVKEGENFADIFSFDMEECWPFKMVADLDFVPVTIEENEDTRLVRDGNGALLRRHKKHDTTPEHVDFLVKDRANWLEYIKPKLVADDRRINFEAYRNAKARAKEKNRFFFYSGVLPFELMHPVCGHEYMLMGMALDPDWVRDMVNTYSRLTVELEEILFAKEGLPDGFWYYEDMGFLGRPFMSPQMYMEIVQPGHRYVFDYNKSIKKPVLVHSCGMVEKLIPGLLEAGMDCLQVIEVKAGMDLLKLYKEYGHCLSFMGGIDVRELYTNDIARVRAEIDKKVPIVKAGFGYTLHSDHSIPNTVDFATYREFIEYGLNAGTL